MSINSCTCRHAAYRGAIAGAIAGGVIVSAFVYECIRDMAFRRVNPSASYVALVGGMVCGLPSFSALLGAGIGVVLWRLQ